MRPPRHGAQSRVFFLAIIGVEVFDVDTIKKTKVRLDDLTRVMQHLTKSPIPEEVLARRRKLLAEAESVRASMEPMSEDIKDLIRKERRESSVG